jgi:hypothetical protein
VSQSAVSFKATAVSSQCFDFITVPEVRIAFLKINQHTYSEDIKTIITANHEMFFKLCKEKGS